MQTFDILTSKVNTIHLHNNVHGKTSIYYHRQHANND